MVGSSLRWSGEIVADRGMAVTRMDRDADLAPAPEPCGAVQRATAWINEMASLEVDVEQDSDRIVSSALAERAVAGGFATPGELQELSDGWREWASSPDGWFAVLNGEVLCRG